MATAIPAPFPLGEPTLAHEPTHAFPSGKYETLTWTGKADAIRQSMALGSLTGEHYDAFVPPMIANTRFQPSGHTLALAEESTVAIARFDERYGQHLAPLATLLLRSESAASSRIENHTASARSLGEAELESTEKTNATLVVRNVRAMEAALTTADEINTASVLRMHEALMDGTPDQDVAGQWRPQQVWIGTSVVSPIGATFVPPKFERVPELMDDVMAYARRPDVPVMVQAAICHAQFETIHPFTDGNGRTGPALLHSMLKHRRVA